MYSSNRVVQRGSIAYTRLLEGSSTLLYSQISKNGTETHKAFVKDKVLIEHSDLELFSFEKSLGTEPWPPSTIREAVKKLMPIETYTKRERSLTTPNSDDQNALVYTVTDQLQYNQTISPGLLLPENYELLKEYCTDKEYPKVLHYISDLCLHENTCNSKKSVSGWVCYGHKRKEKIFGRTKYTKIISLLSSLGFTEHIHPIRGKENREKNHKRMERLGELFKNEQRVIIPFPNKYIKKKHLVKKKSHKRINRNDIAYRIEKHLKSLKISSTSEHLNYILNIQGGGKLIYEWRVFNDIKRGNIHLIQDSFAKRVYHPLLAGAEARRHIKVNGHSLVEADIEGSHTYIYHQLLLSDGVVSLPQIKIDFRPAFNLTNCQKDTIRELMNKDIYTLIAAYHNENYPKLNKIDRNGGKVIFQKALSGTDKLSSKILKIIYGFKTPLFSISHKLKSSQVSSYVLSSIEKQIVFEAWNRFNISNPDTPCIPRHDSLSTYSTHVQEVEENLKDVFKEAFSSSKAPLIKPKEWRDTKALL